MTDVSPGSDAAAIGFEGIFGRPPSVSASAPGRVNLIGEHTDYNGGYVLPVAIPQRTEVQLAARADRVVRVWSANIDGLTEPLEYELGVERGGRGWLDYIQGLTHVLAKAGLKLSGFDARIASDIPLGGGLASSAALEIALGRALRAAFELSLDDIELALMARRAENDFVGAPVGIMDQMASSLAGQRTALFLDARTLDWRRVPLPDGIELAVIDSGVAHAHASGQYRARRDECARAAALLGVGALRDATPADLPRLASLPPPLDRRARHVITENGRVLATVTALEAGDPGRAGRLLYEAHASLRDDFEVSIPQIDRLVDLARGEPAVVGARLTGGGFGGSIVLLVRAGNGVEAADRIAGRYAAVSAYRPRVHLPFPFPSLSPLDRVRPGC